MKKRSFVLGVIIIFLGMNASFAGTLGWQAVGTNFLYDSDNLTELATGCLVQLILDVDGDGLDSIEFTGFSDPAGDDILMPNSSGGNTGAIGDGMPPPVENMLGHFSISTIFDNEDSAPNYSGEDVYVRFWNAASPGISNYYGESAAYTLLSGSTPQTFNIISGGSLYTNTHLVPEPSAAFLIISGLMGLFAFYRKKR